MDHEVILFTQQFLKHSLWMSDFTRLVDIMRNLFYLISICYFSATSVYANTIKANNEVMTPTLQQRVVVKGDHQPLALSSHTWQAKRNVDLYDTLYLWGKKAGWHLVWQVDDNYTLIASAHFKGNFIQAVTQLFASLGETSPHLYVSFYQQNKVLLVSSQPQS